MTTHNTEFPFDVIATFNTIQEGYAKGFSDAQIWAVIESEGTFAYVPPHHYVNRLHFAATAEHHDGDTYYEEPPEEHLEGTLYVCDGFWLDSKEPFEGLIVSTGSWNGIEDARDERIFYYTDGDPILGKHEDFEVVSAAVYEYLDNNPNRETPETPEPMGA